MGGADYAERDRGGPGVRQDEGRRSNEKGLGGRGVTEGTKVRRKGYGNDEEDVQGKRPERQRAMAGDCRCSLGHNSPTARGETRQRQGIARSGQHIPQESRISMMSDIRYLPVRRGGFCAKTAGQNNNVISCCVSQQYKAILEYHLPTSKPHPKPIHDPLPRPPPRLHFTPCTSLTPRSKHSPPPKFRPKRSNYTSPKTSKPGNSCSPSRPSPSTSAVPPGGTPRPSGIPTSTSPHRAPRRVSCGSISAAT